MKKAILVMNVKRKSKLVFGLFITTLLLSAQVLSVQAQNNLELVGNQVPTLIDTPDFPSRAINIVKAALPEYSVNVTATTQAWSGSGLRSGKYAGFIDYYSLNNQRDNYLYSDPYLLIPLHIASRNSNAVEVVRLDKIYRTSLGIENRFANTDQLRSERSVRWARSPDFLTNIKQLAGQRVDYIIADKSMLDEFNKLLLHVKVSPVFLSKTPIYNVQMRLAMRADAPDAAAIIKAFNQGLMALKETGQYDLLLNPTVDSLSLLDEALYQDIIRKW